MYTIPKKTINTLDDFTLSNLELILNKDCNMACSYCFLYGDTNSGERFSRWDDLLEMLKNINISDKLTVGLNSGELFTTDRLPLVMKAMRVLKRITRYKDTTIDWRLYSNGTNFEIIRDFLIATQGENRTISISYDGEDSYRKLKGNKPSNTLDTLKRLSESGFADDIIIRYAITEKVHNMKETFDALYKLGYKNMEYYFIRNYNSYTIPLVVDTFRKSLTDTLNYVKDTDIDLYNLQDYYSKQDPTVICNYGNMPIVSPSGRITTCCAVYEGIYKDDVEVDLLEYNRIPEIYNNFETNYVYDRSKSECAVCANQMCKECCSYKAIGRDKYYNKRHHQQCHIRHTELAVYDSIFN